MRLRRRSLAALLITVAGLSASVDAQAPAAAAQPDSATVRSQHPAPRGRRSWTADRREFAVGDVITVLVDELTIASADRRTDATDTRSRDLGLAVRKPSGVPLTTQVGVSTDNDARSRQSGADSRRNSVVTEMSVRVVAVAPGGLLEVKGTKRVEIDKGSQELALAGWVRPQDVTPTNFVESYRIADASLVITSKGSLGKPRGGIIGGILGRIWP
jgi:flagellar L-ring protein precursor FlgH